MPAKKLPDGMTKRGAVYWAWFRHDGKLIRKSLSRDRRVAEEMLADLKLRAYRREEGIVDNDVDLQNIFHKWLQMQSQHRRESTVERYRQNINRLNQGLVVRRVSHLSHEVIFDYREKRLQDASPRTVNMEVAALNTALRWAVGQKLIGTNPVAEIKQLPHIPKVGRALERSEVNAILAASSKHYCDIWYCLFHTGLRRGELVNLRFGDVDWKNREIVVRVRTGSKTKRERRIPVNDKLFGILKAKHDDAPFRVPGKRCGPATTKRMEELFSKDRVFVTKQNTPLGQNLHPEFLATCERAGVAICTEDSEGNLIEHVDLHSTRRTFITQLIESGVNPRAVQELVGHKDSRLTMEVYAKVRGDTRRRAMADLSYDEEPVIIPITA